jgi:hypothetical protein
LNVSQAPGSAIAALARGDFKRAVQHRAAPSPTDGVKEMRYFSRDVSAITATRRHPG